MSYGCAPVCWMTWPATYRMGQPHLYGNTGRCTWPAASYHIACHLLSHGLPPPITWPATYRMGQPHLHGNTGHCTWPAASYHTACSACWMSRRLTLWTIARFAGTALRLHAQGSHLGLQAASRMRGFQGLLFNHACRDFISTFNRLHTCRLFPPHWHQLTLHCGWQGPSAGGPYFQPMQAGEWQGLQGGVACNGLCTLAIGCQESSILIRFYGPHTATLPLPAHASC